MKKYKKVYLKAFGFDINDPTQFVPSEVNGLKGNDIHHIICRGMGGTTENLDRIENLMCLTRKQHDELGDKKNLIWNLLSVHRQHMKEHGVVFDNEWIEQQMSKYAYETEP